MKLEDSKKWLADHGYKYHMYWMSFMPPNTIVYINDEKKMAHLEDEPYGNLEVDGVDFTNDRALAFITGIINNKSQ